MSTKMETKGICLCKQETHIEDSSRTIVNGRAVALVVAHQSGN